MSQDVVSVVRVAPTATLGPGTQRPELAGIFQVAAGLSQRCSDDPYVVVYFDRVESASL